jgi:hypothetical protein
MELLLTHFLPASSDIILAEQVLPINGRDVDSAFESNGRNMMDVEEGATKERLKTFVTFSFVPAKMVQTAEGAQ